MTRTLAALLLTMPALALADPPGLRELNPPAFQRGVANDVRIYGSALTKDVELILPFAAEVRGGGNNGESATFQIKPAANVPIGVYPVRVRTPDGGISNLRLINVVDVPVIRVKDPNGRYRAGKL